MTGSEPYRYTGGGSGEIHPPGTVAEDYAQLWDIRCFLWTGSQWWTAERHKEVSEDPALSDVRDRFAGWSSEDRMRLWLEAQTESEARKRREATRYPN